MAKCPDLRHSEVDLSACGTEIGCVNRCSIKSKNVNTTCNQTAIPYTFFYKKPSKGLSSKSFLILVLKVS